MQRRRRTAAATKGQTRLYAERRRSRSEGDHSDAAEAGYRKMTVFEPPEGGHIELRNGADLEAEIERVAREVERCARAS